MPILYIIATPIGNLKDISSRALETLKDADLVLCEDTRVTRKLLEHYGIDTAVISYHQHSGTSKVSRIVKLLEQGKSLALVSDAGTPGVSDPGNKLIEKVFEKMGEKIKVVPVPGPSAVMAAASICGFSMDKFIFLGFPPAKKKRNKFFQEVKSSKLPVIFFESPHRIIKALEQLASPGRRIVVCRELTKMFEAIYRGDSAEAAEAAKKNSLKGEFVIVFEGKTG